MDERQFNQIWDKVREETNNRSRGSFKRALWYGNNSMVFGQNKGLRKAIRNAPRKIAMGALGAGLGAAAVPPGVSDLISMAVDTVLNKGKDVYSNHVKSAIKGTPPMSAEEALRKQVKSSVKDLKSNAFQVIDRNLVKLRDAKNSVSPAIQGMMQSTDDNQLEKAHEALKAIAETQYYTDKITNLVTATCDALTRIKQDLDQFKAKAQTTENEVSDYIKEYM